MLDLEAESGLLDFRLVLLVDFHKYNWKKLLRDWNN
jgi:hypothetical protein